MNCNNVIDLGKYQRFTPEKRESANCRAERVLLHVESVVTGIIGLCTLVCLGLVLSML